MLGKVKISVSGVNLDRSINELKNKFGISNVFKVHNTKIIFVAPVNYYAKIIDYLQAKCYNINVIQFSLLLRLNMFFKKYFWQIILLVLCIGLLCAFFNTIVGAKIVKDSTYNTSIMQTLKEDNIFGKWSKKIDCKNLELLICNHVPELSLVNVSIKGCFVLIDYTIKELPKQILPAHSGPILAQKSGVVSKIFVTQGTPLVKPNTYVRAGQALIGDYFLDKDGNTVQCEAKGEVYVFNWQSSTVEFCEDSVQYVPTGEETICSSLIVFGKEIKCKQKEVPYQNYCTQQTEFLLTHFAIPIHIVYTHYLQTVQQKMHTDFDACVDSLKMQARENVLKNIEPQNILEDKYTISHVGDIYFVTYYAKSESLIT